MYTTAGHTHIQTSRRNRDTDTSEVVNRTREECAKHHSGERERATTDGHEGMVRTEKESSTAEHTALCQQQQ